MLLDIFDKCSQKNDCKNTNQRGLNATGGNRTDTSFQRMYLFLVIIIVIIVIVIAVLNIKLCFASRQ